MPTIPNVLTVLAIALILVWSPVVILVFNDWGWSSRERLILIAGFGGLAIVTLITVVYMAQLRGQPLFAPKEKAFGSETEALTKSEAEALPAAPQQEGAA